MILRVNFFFTNCTAVDHHHSPPFGKILFTLPSIEHATSKFLEGLLNITVFKRAEKTLKTIHLSF